MLHRKNSFLLGICLLLAGILIVLLHIASREYTAAPDFTSSQNATRSTLGQTYSQTEQRIIEYAAAHGHTLADYPHSLIDLMDRNPETEKFVLEYPQKKDLSVDVDLANYDADTIPLFLQWDQQWGYLPYGADVAGLTACGPVCLSMAAYYLTQNEDFAPDKMIQFALAEGYCTYGDGTSWTLISEGAKALGFDVTELPLEETRIIENLSVGNPIICVVGPGDFTSSGHYILLSGYQDGMIKVNDPNSTENSSRLWDYSEICDQIEVLWVIRSM